MQTDSYKGYDVSVDFVNSRMIWVVKKSGILVAEGKTKKGVPVSLLDVFREVRSLIDTGAITRDGDVKRLKCAKISQ